MIQRLLSKETMERFLSDFKNKTEWARQNKGKPFLSPNETALILDAINAWESYRQNQFALTFYDKSRIFMESKTVPTTNAFAQN